MNHKFTFETSVADQKKAKREAEREITVSQLYRICLYTNKLKKIISLPLVPTLRDQTLLETQSSLGTHLFLPYEQ